MKRNAYLAGCLLACTATLPVWAQAPTPQTFIIPANKGYAEPFTEGDAGVSIPVGDPAHKDVVSRWRNKDRSVVWYLYQKAGTYDLLLDQTVTKGRELRFHLQVSSPAGDQDFTPMTRPLVLKGTGSNDTAAMARIVVPHTGYYRYALQPETDPAAAIVIRSLLFRSSDNGAEVHQTEYQSSPSVHLSFKTTDSTTKSYDWLYEEILVPEGGDALVTYYEAIGFFRGYMGIQTNSSHERRVLFSVWDSKDAEKDKSIQQNDYVSLVGKGPATVTNKFGGEGTGGQSYVPTANWKTGKPVKFLMNIRMQENNTIVVSAWYQVDGEDWNYIASWRAPKEHRYFDGFYSFIENFWNTNGQMRREAYYYNAWGHESSGGKWVNFNKVGFSHTDGREGQRVDYEQGVSAKYPDRFYMSSGGYTPTLKTADQMPLRTQQPLDGLARFEKDVDHALEQEAQQKVAGK